MARLAVVLVGVFVCVAGSLGAVAGLAVGTDANGGHDSLGLASGELTESAEWQVRNVTLHEHPDEIDDDADLGQVSGWLGLRLAGMLGESTVELSREEYELARSLVGDDYDHRLGQFVTVADELARDRDHEAVTAFGSAGDDQREFIAAVREYRDTYEAYQDAREAGETERARELARELDEAFRAVDRHGRSLEQAYGVITDTTRGDLSQEMVVSRSIREEIEGLQTDVRADEFVPVELVVALESERVSFLEPIRAVGDVRTPGGEPVTTGSVVLEAGAQTTTATIGAAGGFDVAHRPTVLALATESVTVRYLPEPGSPYASAETTLPIRLGQVEPSLTITDAPEDGGFGDPVRVGGTVAAAGIPAVGVPVVVFVGPERVGVTETDPAGTFRFDTVVPAAVPAGDTEIEVVLPLREQALARTATTHPFSIEETPTQVTVAGEQDGDDLVVTGELTTAAGEPVPGQPIRITTADTSAATVETDANGAYRAWVQVPEQARTGSPEDVVVVAAYEDSRTNLGDATADTMVSVIIEPPDAGVIARAAGLIGGLVGVITGITTGVEAPGIGDPIQLAPGEPGWLWHGIAIGLSAVLAHLAATYLSRTGLLSQTADIVDRTPGDDLPPAHADSSPEPEGPDTEDTGLGALGLDTARAALEAGDPDGAVEAAYTAARVQLQHRVPPGAWTHWEFHEALQANGLPNEDVEVFGALTEQYEHAAFAPVSLSPDDATEAIFHAERLVASDA